MLLPYGLEIFATAPERGEIDPKARPKYELHTEGQVRISPIPKKNIHGLIVSFPEKGEGHADISSEFGESAEDTIFVLAKKGSFGRITDACAGNAALARRTFFVLAEEGAHVEIVSTERFSPNTSAFFRTFSHIHRSARISRTEFYSGGKFIQSHAEDFLLEEAAQSWARTVFLAANQEFDILSSARHAAQGTASRISARGVLGSGAKAIYRGQASIEKGMPHSDASQEAKFFLAAPNAEIDAIPSLDIGNPNVRAAHAVSIGHLGEQSFFYPGLRGIEPYVAQSMLFEGFLANEIPEWENGKIRAIIKEKLRSPLYNYA